MCNVLKKYRSLIPSGIGALFLIEMILTFTFSILSSTLILYITNQLQLRDNTATSIIAAFFAINYVLHLMGGYMGGRWISNRFLLLIGFFCQLTGCALLSHMTIDALLWGLSLFVMGTGLSSTCISCMITQFFAPGDKRRETIFILNYSSFNISYLIGFSVSGYFQLFHAYSSLFMLGSLSSLIALFVLIMNWKLLRDNYDHLHSLTSIKKFFFNIKGIALIVVIILATHFLFHHVDFANGLVSFIAISIAILLIIITMKQPVLEVRNKMLAYLMFALALLIFNILCQLTNMNLILFIQRNVDLHFAGWEIAPQWLKSISSITTISGGPLLSYLFTYLRAQGIAITIPRQFTIALILMGIAFLTLSISIFFSNAEGYININWIILSYVMQAIAGLFILPIGYALVGQLAPIHLRGLMMGAWFMITGVAATFCWYFSRMTLGMTSTVNPLITNTSYSYTFSLLGGIAILAGIILALLTPYLLNLIQEK